MTERPKLLPVTEEMKEWSVHLDRELSSWPDVIRKPMFGMIAFYRRGVIFAAIPRTKSFEPANSIGFKLYTVPAKTKTALENDPRIYPENPNMTGWISFEVRESHDLNSALEWLTLAYDGTQGVSARSATRRSPR